MLTLAVKAGEYVMIGDNIRVCVTKGKTERLRLSIDAPKDITILRSGVIEKLQNQSEEKTKEQV